MARTKSDRRITKDIENITIAEYMEYEAEIKRDPWGYAQTYTRSSGSITLEKNEEVSSDEVVDEWLNAEMSKRMTGQDKEEEQDALIDIFKIVVKECKSIYKKAQIKVPSSRTSKIQGISLVTEEEEDESSKTLPFQLPPKEMNPLCFTLPCTIGNLKLSAMANLGAGVNVMPKSLFGHLKLANLKETSMEVEMADMTKKAPLGIVENILVKIDKFLFHSDFVVIDMLEGLNETMRLGRPFLATIHAQIDVFRREISLGIGEEKESENFNPLEIENDVFYYDSPVCLLLERGTPSCSEESIDTIDSSHDMQELEGQWPTCNPDLSFCSGYDAIYGQEESGMLKQWICFQDHERQNVGGNGMIFDDFLKVRYENKNIDDLENEYELKAGRKRYGLDKVWEKCEKFHDTTKLWYDKGFEEEELWQNGIEDIDYTPPLVKSETFEVHRYTFKNRKSFISITKQIDDFLTLGRVNRSRFMEKTKKEMDEGKRTTRKT
ncbi:RNA-directed DNA polymerase, eukaryota, reverse transcriptase zinc-binding domain protein [Tanacetum coccineum]